MPSRVETTTPASMWPACATEEYASIRFSEDWPIAPTLPTAIVTSASTASAGPHVVAASISATSNSRSSTPNAAALVATAMNPVTAVGAPSYTSGVHWWNGATDALNASPATTSAMPVNSSTSSDAASAIPT